MKLDNINESQNIEDKRGQTRNSSPHSSSSSTLLGLLFAHLGWKGRLILLVGVILLVVSLI